MTLAVPDDLHREMRKHRDIRWAEIARRALRREIDRLHVYDRLVARSHLNESESVELGRSVRRRESPSRR